MNIHECYKKENNSNFTFQIKNRSYINDSFCLESNEALINFIKSPCDNILKVINIAEKNSFFLTEAAFNALFFLLLEKKLEDQALYLLFLFVQFPNHFYVNELPEKLLIYILENYLSSKILTIRIFSFIAKQSGQFNMFFIENNILKKVFHILTENTDLQTKNECLYFFRCILKNGFAFMEENFHIYNFIASTDSSNSLPREYSMYVLYHYYKSFISFYKIKDLRNNFSPFKDQIKEWAIKPFNSVIWMKYFLKIVYVTTKLKGCCKFFECLNLNIFELLNTVLDSVNHELILIYLRSIYNHFIDARWRDVTSFQNSHIAEKLLRSYESFPFSIQREILSVISEYLRWIKSEEIVKLFEDYNLYKLLLDAMRTGGDSNDDFFNELFFFYFIICDIFDKENFHEYTIKYFLNEEFNEIIEGLENSPSEYYEDFLKCLSS